MADTDSYTQRLEFPPQRLVSEVAYPNPIPQNQTNQSKFYSHFLYKALSVAIVLVIIPLFPSQAPEFIDQTIFTRTWELLHLLFVGIAVSYGLFSRRNVETEKEFQNQVKIDTPQTYMSRILQVSNVFDDEVDTSFGVDENKVDTWNSKYFRGEPDVVVEEETPVVDEQSSVVTNVTSSSSSNKPLLLPVRSLKSSVSDLNAVKSVNESPRSVSRSGSGSLSRSGSGVKSGGGNSDNNRDREFGVLDPVKLEEKINENVVLPSPIPWRSRSGRMEMKEDMSGVTRSRSGRMEMKEDMCGVTPPMYSLPPSVEDYEFDQVKMRSFSSPMGQSSQPNSTSPSPKKLSPSPSPSPELRSKSMEDSGKKKSGYKPSPPPPPPLPPSMTRFGTQKRRDTFKSRSYSDGFSAEKEYMKSGFEDEVKSGFEDVVKNGFEDEVKESRRIGREDLPRRRDLGMDSLKSEVKPRTRVEGPVIGKSVRTIKASEPNTDTKKSQEIGDLVEGKADRRSKEVDAVLKEKPSRKTGGFEQQDGESLHPPPKPTYSMYQKKGKKKLGEKVILECEEYSSSETDDDVGVNSDTEKADANNVGDEGPDPNEVDKKADEFIAKFREQIRLQRIDSFKRSSGQLSSRKAPR